MKKYFISFVLFCSFTFVQAQSGDQRTVTTKIADLLARMPASNAQKSGMDMQEIAEMGAEGLQDMIAMLSPAGKGDNTELQYALSGFSNYVSKPGNEKLREQASMAYGKALEKITDPGNKAFVIRQLEAVGNDGSVAFLTPYLQNERLADPAARALVRIHTATARKALLDALQNASGDIRLTLIEALGDCRSKEAASAISAFANSDDKKLSKVSLYALARIADPASASLLAAAAEKSHWTYDETGATQAYLDYADQLNAEGNTAQAEQIADSVLQKANAENQVHTRTAALKILTGIQKEKSVPLLITAMKDPDPKYRAAALKFAEGFRGDEPGRPLGEAIESVPRYSKSRDPADAWPYG